jgi:hypothetical protein
MNLAITKIGGWAGLAWVAKCNHQAEAVGVLHGPMVEMCDEWVVEGVWDGEFEKGEFDTTDLVFGTGVRLRDGEPVFVASGTVFDRLWHCCFEATTYVANSLPALLAVTGAELLDEYPSYSGESRRIIRGLEAGARSIPTTAGPVHMHYYHNLVLGPNGLEVVEKPDTAPRFETYGDYRSFLRRTTEALGRNLSDPARRFPVTAMTSLSSGYDSSVAAVVSRDAGCSKAVTITQSTSLWRGSDSGEEIARHLDLDCQAYDRVAEHYPNEVALWAGEGRAGILNWTQYDYPEPLCLFFTGCHGEKMWDRVSHDHPDPFVRRDTSSLGFTEWRLHKGVFQCVVPFWGVRHSHELHAITANEMQPWYYGPDGYDKPIARRIVEEAGVPREAFGQVNKNTSMESRFLWPHSRDAQESFAAYLSARGVRGFSRWSVGAMRLLSKSESLFYYNLLKRIGMRRRHFWWDRLRLESWPFKWANDVLRERYCDGLQEAGVGARQ